MTLAKIVFMQNLSSEIATLIKDQALDNMEVTLLDHQTSKEVQIKSLERTKYLILYAQTLSDDVLRESRSLEFIQLLSAGYDQLNLKLMKKLGIQCANNGGANSWAVSASVACNKSSASVALSRRPAALRRGPSWKPTSKPPIGP